MEAKNVARQQARRESHRCQERLELLQVHVRQPRDDGRGRGGGRHHGRVSRGGHVAAVDGGTQVAVTGEGHTGTGEQSYESGILSTVGCREGQAKALYICICNFSWCTDLVKPVPPVSPGKSNLVLVLALSSKNHEIILCSMYRGVLKGPTLEKKIS